jgi:hypothetical protein
VIRKPSLLEVFPEIAKEANGWDPSSLSPGSSKKMEWKCKKGHLWIASLAERTGRSKTGCPFCSNRRVLSGFNDLKSLHPDLAHQILGVNPSEVLAGSNKRYEWKCEKGHVWSAVLYSRRSGTGCPYCSGNKVLAGYNDLATTHSEIAKQAHNWDPTKFSAGSDKVQEWICSEGHVWKTAIKHRTLRKSGCTVCGNRSLRIGINDLATVHPRLVKEADGWDPTQVLSGARDKLSWKCSEGHKWKASLLNRTRRGDKCPYCSGKLAYPGFNDLASLRPDLASELIDADASKITLGSGKKYKWKCSKGHIYTTTVNSRAGSKESGCNICANKVLVTGLNDLATGNPEMAAQADGWDPSTVIMGSNVRRNWKCSLGHKWTTSLNSRLGKDTGCPYCSGRYTLAGFNDLATTHPALAKQAHGWDPTKARFGSEKKVEWICDLGHVWKATPNARTSQVSNCPICGNQQLLVGFNDLATTHPAIAAEARGWDPSKYIASHSLKMWECDNGHKWKASISNRKKGNGCPTCSPTGFDPNELGWLYFLRDDEREFFQIGITNHPDQRLAKHYSNGWNLIELRGPMDGHLARSWETTMLRFLASKGLKLSQKSGFDKFDGFSESWLQSEFQVNKLKSLMDLASDYEESTSSGSDS